LSIGLIGKKSGMSRLFLEDGESIPVTAISVCGNFVADIKTKENNVYNAVVLSWFFIRI
jgi:large subunit ribosomal protein L3